MDRRGNASPQPLAEGIERRLSDRIAVLRGARLPINHTGFVRVIEHNGERVAVPCSADGTPMPREGDLC